MSALEALTTEFHSVLTKAEALGHTGLDELRSIWARLTGDVPALEAEAVADAKQVEADAVTAAEPVIAEAEGDVKTLAGEVVADVEGAAAPQTTPDVAPAGPAAPAV